MTIKTVKYSEKYKEIWNNFLENSKNGIFLINRDYMEYHSDRFCDHSLMFYDDDKLVAIMPANSKNDVIYSHEGLTHGGIISDSSMKITTMLEIFNSFKQYFKSIGINKIIYKAIPHIYHSIPAEEDLYALYINNAKLLKKEPSSVINIQNRLEMNKNKIKGIKKSLKNGIIIEKSNDYDTFMNIMGKILKEKYNTTPTHTANEIKFLADKFPDNIKLYGAFKNGEMIAGVIIYENKNVIHAQYGANGEIGKKLRGIESIDYHILNNSEKRYYDYGISTEDYGRYLNIGLITQKEECGARTLTYDTYEMEISEN